MLFNNFRTALAESELVYKHDHKSLSVFVSARLVEVPPALKTLISSFKSDAGIAKQKILYLKIIHFILQLLIWLSGPAQCGLYQQIKLWPMEPIWTTAL
jgi:hypothetical protein